MNNSSSLEWLGLSQITDNFDTLYQAGTSYRVLPIRETLKRILPLKNKLGITRVAEITELDNVGLPVITVTRPSVNSVQITATQGKGTRAVDALVSGFMEAIERHSAAAFKRTIIADIKSLQSQNKNYVKAQQLGTDYGNDFLIEWVTSIDLLTGKEILMPAAEVLFPYFPPEGVCRPVRPSTTGLASGNSRIEAIIHGLFEVVERSITSDQQVNESAKMLDISSIDDPVCLEIIEKFKKAFVELVILDLSTNALMPTYKVISLSDTFYTPVLPVAGQGTHLSPVTALRRALTENAQSRCVGIQGSREDLSRNSAAMKNLDSSEVKRNFNLLKSLASSNGVSKLTQSTVPLFKNLEEMARYLCRKIYDAGHPNILYTDLTDPELRIPVVHTSILGLVDRVVDPRRYTC